MSDISAPDLGRDPAGDVDAPDAPDAGDDFEDDAPEPEGDPTDRGVEANGDGDPKKLRYENKTLRARAKEYEDAFSGLSDDHRSALLEAGRLLNEDPKAFADEMEQVIKAIRGADEPKPEVDPSQPMTRAEMEAFLADRDKQTEMKRFQDEARREVEAEATKLGYDTRSDAPQEAARLYDTLLMWAGKFYEGDIAKAHEAIDAWRRGAVADVVAEKKRQRQSSPPVVNGQPASDVAKPLEWGSKEWKAAIAAGDRR